MESAQPFVLRWGIISTGRVASSFVMDILLDPKTRDVHDVVHQVTAVGSRNLDSAIIFIAEKAYGDPTIMAYGSYDQVYADPNVDVVYVATPHALHYECALGAIRANKHVLCEKPVTLNAAELRSLLAAAKEHGVFFMEAFWTRFQPLVLEVKKIVEDGVLGNPVALTADSSIDIGLDKLPPTHRMLDPMLGGGALLEIGTYPLMWAILVLYGHPSNKGAKPSNVTGTMLKTPLTDVDRSTSFTVTFSPDLPISPNRLAAQAVLSCNIHTTAHYSAVVIRFERGMILVPAPIPCPTSFTVQYFAEGRSGTIASEETRRFEYYGFGFHFQADEVARCVRDGKTQSELWSHEESLMEMEILDEVRRQGGYKLPPGVEKVVGRFEVARRGYPRL